LPYIVAATAGFPPYYYNQAELTAMLREFWQEGRSNVDRLERLHQNLMVNGRHLALPLEWYQQTHGFGATNDAWIEAALDLGETTLCKLLSQTGLHPGDIAQLTTTTVTGLAVPSLDARLMNRIPFAPTLKRVPLFGLGCLGGAAGVARVADYLRGHPTEAAVLLSVELCSLTAQFDDLSIANIISAGLFGDGAAAVLMVGNEHPLARPGRPQVIDSRSCFFPNTERVMGWDIGDTGFKVVLNAAVPDIAGSQLRPALEAFLAEHDLTLSDIRHWIAHPGGPKVIQAMQESLELDDHAFALSWQSLAEVGNVSSASVLFILKATIDRHQPPAGTYGILMAMGPAFCAELVLLRW
jgi:alkylresorcinol/alkylpyrone synthase